MSIVIPSKGGSLPLPLLLGSLATQDFGQKGGTDARQTHKQANTQNTNRQIHKIEMPKKLGKFSRLEEEALGVGEVAPVPNNSCLQSLNIYTASVAMLHLRPCWDKDLGTSRSETNLSTFHNSNTTLPDLTNKIISIFANSPQHWSFHRFMISHGSPAITV